MRRASTGMPSRQTKMYGSSYMDEYRKPMDRTPSIFFACFTLYPLLCDIKFFSGLADKCGGRAGKRRQ